MRARSKWAGLLCVTGVLALAMWPAIAFAGVTTTTATLSAGKFYVRAPSVSGKVIAWFEQPAAVSELWVRRANGVLKHVPTYNALDVMLPPAIAVGRYVVWSEVSSTGRRQLHMYDSVADSAPTTLTTDPVDKTLPVASGAWLVWVETSGPTSTLKRAYMPSFSPTGTVEVHAGPIDQLALFGTQLVYRTSAGLTRNLVTRDILSGPVTLVAADPGVDSPQDPAISQGWIAWHRLVSGEWRLFVKSRATGAVVTPPPGAPVFSANPALADSNLAYAPTTGGVTDALLWNITGGRVLTASSGGDARYTAVRGRLVAYSQRTAGTWGMKWTQFRVGTDRTAGADRYAVAADAARAAYPEGCAGVSTIVVACGEDKAAADPLAAAGLCWKYDAPLLLTASATLSAPAKAAMTEISLAHPGVKVIVVGGPGSVSEAVLAQMRTIVGAANVERLLATGTRYELAAKIAERMRLGPGGKSFPVDPVALVVNGADQTKFFDALAMSAVARASGNPVLLVGATTVPLATANALAAMSPQGVVVAGGTGTVSASVYTAVGGTARWAGADRYATAVKVAEGAIANGYCVPDSIALTAKLPDGVSGGAMIGRARGVLLVTPMASLAAAPAAFASDHWTDIWSARVLGGTASVSPDVLTSLDARLNP